MALLFWGQSLHNFTVSNIPSYLQALLVLGIFSIMTASSRHQCGGYCLSKGMKVAPPQKHHRKNSTQKHHHKNTTTKTPPQKHHHTTTKTPLQYYSSNSLYYTVLLRTTKNYSSTTLYYKVPLQYCSVLQSTTVYHKVLFQYYSVLQSTTPVLPRTTSTTPVLLCTTKYYSSTTKCYSSTTLYYKILQRVARRHEKFAFYHWLSVRHARSDERVARVSRRFCILPQYWACTVLPRIVRRGTTSHDIVLNIHMHFKHVVIAKHEERLIKCLTILYATTCSCIVPIWDVQVYASVYETRFTIPRGINLHDQYHSLNIMDFCVFFAFANSSLATHNAFASADLPDAGFATLIERQCCENSPKLHDFLMSFKFQV